MKNYWLLKSEPDSYSIDDLNKDGKTLWEGVRNYQARNFMTQSMRENDLALFYHSSAEPTGIVGLAQITKVNVVDSLQFQKKSEFFDPKATKEKPIWYCAEVKFIKKFKSIIDLSELKKYHELSQMKVLQRGQRLSVQPVSEAEYQFISTLIK